MLEFCCSLIMQLHRVTEDTSCASLTTTVATDTSESLNQSTIAAVYLVHPLSSDRAALDVDDVKITLIPMDPL